MLGSWIHLKGLAAGLVVAALFVTGFAGPATAAPVKTTVTIDNTLPRLYGYVRSANPARCSAKRLVFVFKVRDAAPDRVVGQGRARKFRKVWQWSLAKPTGQGRFYARTAQRTGCAQDKSQALPPAVPIQGNDMPDCPLTSGNMCKIATKEDKLMFASAILRTCPSFTRSSGDCDGHGRFGVEAFGGDRGANFHWNENGRGPFRGVAYYSANGSYLEGSTPDAGSDRFSIRESRIADDIPRTWCTPDLPNIPAGQTGGPISLDFKNQEIGAKVFFYGVLQRKSSHPGEC